MARTRSKIKSMVGHFTGRATEKASLIEELCDEALQVAISHHPFKEAMSFQEQFAITEDSASVDISSLTGLRHVISGTILEADSERSTPLIFKDETWWNKNVVEEDDNMKGWPVYALRRETTVYLNCPAEEGLTLQLAVATDQSFTTDDTECPIAVADLFVTQYVTAFVFFSVEELEKYKYWYNLAMGYQYVMNGKVGGTLGDIIDLDRTDRATVMKAERTTVSASNNAVAVKNDITGHSDYGNIRMWY